MGDASVAGLRLSTASSEVDRDAVGRMLHDTYWAASRSREVQDAAIDASQNFSVFDASGRQVAYARVVTDGATFAYLCDVVVDDALRGHGVGRFLVAQVMQHLQALGDLEILLTSRDAGDLYRKAGFSPLEHPARWLQQALRADTR